MLIVVKKETRIPVKDAYGRKVSDPTKDGKDLFEIAIQDESIDVFDIKKIRPHTEVGVDNDETTFSMVSVKDRSHKLKIKENWKYLTERVNNLRSGRVES